jgi:hypothetical protein
VIEEVEQRLFASLFEMQHAGGLAHIW